MKIPFILFCLATSLPILGSAQTPSFTKTDIAVSGSPRTVAIADFTGDGKPDLAITANYPSANNVLIYPGVGDGNFQQPITTVVGPGLAGRIAIADLNLDGRPDVVTFDGSNNFIAVLLGNGNGTFVSPANHINVGVTDVGVGDVNGDGIPDIAGTIYSSTVMICLGQGNGAFSSPAYITIPNAFGLVRIGLADLNGDGKADVVTSNYTSSSISVLVGKGDGAFLPAVNYTLATDGFPQALSIGDLNQDGVPDIVVGKTGSRDFVVLLGSGNGAFGTPRVTATSDFITAIVTADTNLDGKRDIVVATGTANNYVTVYVGNNDGTFELGVQMPVGIDPLGLAAEDLNADGKLDLVSVNRLSTSLSVLLNTGNGSEIVYPPRTPSGSTKMTTVSFGGYGTDGAFSSQTHSIQYLIDWGDGSNSGWFPPGGGSHGWSVVGTYLVKAKARCAIHTGVESAWSGALTVVVSDDPILDVSKTHAGDFLQGQNGAVFTITVHNVQATGTTNGVVTVTETVPDGLTLVGMAGTGWTCSGRICSRSDPLRGSSGGYPPITVTVNVSSTAPARVTNNVTVAGGGSPAATASNIANIYAPCSVTFNSSSATAGGSDGRGLLNVMAASTCHWSAVSDVTWLIVNSPPANVGNNTVDYLVLANPTGASRTGNIVINGAAFAVTQFAVALETQALQFVPVAPCRIADTRNSTGPFGGPVLGAAGSRDFLVPYGACVIPLSARAYSLNITAVPLGGLGFLSVWPTGLSQPLVSTLNSSDGRVKANAAIVPAGVNGGVTIFASHPTHVIVDINGFFVPAGSVQSLAFYPVTPCRLADTRSGTGAFAGPLLAANVPRNFPVPSGPCGIPVSAKAYALNMTAAPAQGLGFLSVWPSGFPQPGTSTLNAPTGTVTSNLAIVPAGTDGGISVIATNPTDLIIDITGYFAPPGRTGALDFYPVAPCRILDTRSTTGPLGGPQMESNQTRSFPAPASGCGAPINAKAFSLNATVVPPAPLGFLTLWGGGGMPLVSTLNSYDGSIVANAALTPAGPNGMVTAFTSNPSHLILDINGYFQ